MGNDGHRDEKPAAGKPPAWDLRGLFPSPAAPEIEKAITAHAEAAADFAAKYKGKVQKLPAKDLAAAIAAFEKVSEEEGRISSYADLIEAADRNDAPVAAALRDRLRKASGEMLFFTFEINGIKEVDLLGKIADPALAAYAPWIRKLRAAREHQLDAEVEKYLHDKLPVTEGAWSRLYDMTVAGLRFDVRGEKLTEAETLNIISSSPDGALRREAFAEFTRVLGENKKTFGLILNTVAEVGRVSDSWRSFESAADARHLANQTTREEVEALIKAVRDSYPRTSHRYYAWKARQMGGKLLHPADRNAPLPGAAMPEIPWEEAKKTVLEAFTRLHPDMARAAQAFFDENRIDAEPRAGKDSGAFSHPVTPSARPYILMNYFGTPGDVMTLAHELGHGVHQTLANAQGYLKADTPLTLAETASIFGEMLVFRALLDGEEDLLKKRALLAGKIEDMLNSCGRQAAFFCFEQRIHEERAKKGELSPERIAQVWQETQKEQLGPSVNLDVAGAEHLWAHIPHFVHSPFYVYAYAFGDCLVNALYDEYEKAPDKAAFAEKYLDLLKAGGSQRPEEALAAFGFDPADPKFWKKGLSVLEKYVDELEAVDRKIEAVLKSKDGFKAAANDIVSPPADDNNLPRAPMNPRGNMRK